MDRRAFVRATLAGTAALALAPYAEASALALGRRRADFRFTRLRYRGVTHEGQAIDRTVSGFHARVVQHECDHLDGILYPQRMTDLRTFGFVEEMKKAFGGQNEPEPD